MNYDYIIDSCIWLDYFSGSTRGDKVKDIIEKGNIVCSIIAVAELADKFARENKPFEDHLLFIKSKCAIIPLSLSMVLEAAHLKKEIRKN